MKKILIVDDENEFADLIKLRLAHYNYQVLTASSGKEALAVCNTNKPDLILLDIVMPGMDGYQTCAELRRAKETSDIPVLFLTAKDLEPRGIIERCKDLDVCGYISKLGSPQELLVKIKEIIG